MAVNPVYDFTGRADPAMARTRQEAAPAAAGDSPQRSGFGDLVKEFAADVNALQFQAGHAINMLATGRAADVHQVMIAVEEAGIAMNLMLEIRNRVLEGYQELIRMQV